jgi:hypothetical protein
MSAVTRYSRFLLPSLLALCIAGMGPSFFAGLPRAINANAEEETRTPSEHVLGSVASSAVRPTRSFVDAVKVRQRHRYAGSETLLIRRNGGGAAHSLRSLQVRIQV